MEHATEVLSAEGIDLQRELKAAARAGVWRYLLNFNLLSGVEADATLQRRAA